MRQSAEGEALRERVTTLAARCNLAEYQFLKALAELVEREAWCGTGVRSCAHWLNFHCGIGESAGREKVRVATRLGSLPNIDAAFSRGELSFSMVRAMTRVATPENEDSLLNIARHGTASHMEQVVRKYRRVKSSLEDSAEQAQRRNRTLSYHRDTDGSWVIRGRLPAEEGALVIKAIEAVARPEQLEEQKAIMEKMEQARKGADPSAETFAEQVEREAPEQFAKVMNHTSADALIKVAEHFLATCGETGDYRGLAGSDRCQVMLHVDINTLRNQDPPDCGHHEHCNLDEQQWVSPATARRLSCDASLLTVLEDEHGEVLNIGRKSRTVPYRMRKALEMRDPCCQFPGCTRKKGLDAHHVRHWADGGETRMDNLLNLCRHHHSLLHRDAYSIKPENNGFTFITATGDRMETALFPQFAEESLQQASAEITDSAHDVDAHTCVPKWYGDRLDYGMAIDGLLSRDGARFSGKAPP